MMPERRHQELDARPKVGRARLGTISAASSSTTQEAANQVVRGTNDVHPGARRDMWPYPPPAYRVDDGDMRYPSWAGPMREAGDDGL